MANGSGNWAKLTRGDLAQFDDVATNVVLYAMERGGVGRLSRRGHVILRAPDGGRTMSVPKDGNRSQHVLELTVRKLFPEPSGESSTTERISADEHIRRIQQNIVPNPTLECTVPGCEAVFVTEGARYTHLNEKHHVCPHPGCFKAGDHKAGIDAHYRIVHQGWRPARGPHKRKAGKTKEPRKTAGDRVLDFFRSRPGVVLTVAEIRAAVEGVDGTTLANYMTRNLGGDWGHVHRVDRGRYVFTPDGETPRETPATEDTTQQEEAPRTEPGDVVGAWKGDLLVEVHAFITKERDNLLERISRLEQENDQLRRSLDGVRKALRDE